MGNMRTRTSSTLGEAATTVILALGLLVAAMWAIKPSLFPGASNRAKKGTDATEQLVDAVDKQGAAAAAGVAKIGEANAMAPESPAKNYITQEVTAVMSKLPAPDAQALIEAEKRRSAVMEGRLDEARRLFETESKRAAQLQKERDEALIARREADLAFEKAAAAEHARTMQLMSAGAVALLLGAAWVWAKLNGFSLGTIADIRASVLKGEPLEVAIDRFASVRQQRAIRREVAVKVDSIGGVP